MFKKLLMIGALVLLANVCQAQTAVGISYVAGTTNSSTPVTIAVPPSGYFSDCDMKIQNPNSVTTGIVVVKSGSVTIDVGTPAAGGGGWISNGWHYTGIVGNNIVLIDVSGIGIQYSFRLWTAQNRNSRP